MRINKITKHQFTILGVSLLAITIIAGLSFDTAFAEKKDKVVLCHIGEFGLETLSVSGNAQAAHIAHGDTLGECTDIPPPAPTLLTPADDAVIDRSTTSFIHFSWSEVFDDDGIDHYELRVLDGESQVVYNINQDTDQPSIANFPVDGQYTWNVRATDGNGNVGAFAATSFSFIIGDSTTTPPAPTLLTPADNAVIDESETSFVPFSWSYPVGSGIVEFELRVLDGENQVVYNIDQDTDTDTNTDTNQPGIANFPVDEYNWSVRGTDAFGNVGPFATPLNFEVVP